jgi:hypothetical protein
MMIDRAPFSTIAAQRAPLLPITYYASKRKALLSLLGCLIFVAIACLFIIDPWVNDPSPQKTRIASFAIIILFGSGVAVSTYMLIWKLRIVTLDETGILIAGHKRWITWAEITNIDLIHQYIPVFFSAGPREIEWIGIFLKDTRAYYASWGPISRRLTAMTERKLGTPILINCSLLPIEPDTLIAWLNEYRAEYSR